MSFTDNLIRAGYNLAHEASIASGAERNGDENCDARLAAEFAGKALQDLAGGNYQQFLVKMSIAGDFARDAQLARITRGQK